MGGGQGPSCKKRNSSITKKRAVGETASRRGRSQESPRHKDQNFSSATRERKAWEKPEIKKRPRDSASHYYSKKKDHLLKWEGRESRRRSETAGSWAWASQKVASRAVRGDTEGEGKKKERRG